MRKTYIAGNWKMNKTLVETQDFLITIKDALHEIDLQDVIPIIAPSFLFVREAKILTDNSKIKIASQNVNENTEGAFTGEVSAKMLRSVNVDYCIIGHSERRHLYNENSDLVGKKCSILMENKIKPIICVGETEEERESGKMIDVIEEQLAGAFKYSQPDGESEIILAYEPLWAIGTGKTATPQQAQDVHSFIRNWLQKNFSTEIANKTPILYGGSVKPENIKELLSQKDIDGGLIGGASLNAEKYINMIKIALEGK